MLKWWGTASRAATRAAILAMLLWALHTEEGWPLVGILRSERRAAAAGGGGGGASAGSRAGTPAAR